MNETEQAELFNKELDALLRGGGISSVSGDGALRLAASLAALDFSGESRIKASLRARLVPAGEGFAALLRGLLANNYARAAFAAAAIAVALLPIARRQPAPQPPAVVAHIAAQAPLGKPLPPSETLAARLPAALRGGGNSGPMFASLPMGELRGEPIKAPVMELSSGSSTERPGGTAIIFETGSGTFALERREVQPEQIFELRTL
ncbi:MAG: hypothetical protein AB7V08_03015 [Elusimicrobiales bacterium]